MNRCGFVGRQSRHGKHASVLQQEEHVWWSLYLLKTIQGPSQGEDDTISSPLTQHLQSPTTCTGATGVIASSPGVLCLLHFLWPVFKIETPLTWAQDDRTCVCGKRPQFASHGTAGGSNEVFSRSKRLSLGSCLYVLCKSA